MTEREPQFNEIANRETIKQMLKEHPAFVVEYQRMVASFGERTKQMKEFVAQYEENERSKVAGYMCVIDTTTEVFEELHREWSTAETLQNRLDTEDFEHLLEGQWGTWSRLLRADAVMQSYILPCLEPMSEEVKSLANTLHTMVTDLQTFMAAQNGAPDQLTHLQPAPEGTKYLPDQIERWLYSSQRGPPDFKKQLLSHIINTAEAAI